MAGRFYFIAVFIVGMVVPLSIFILVMPVYAENGTNWKRYSNCAVYTSIDDFTDKTRHMLTCSDALKVRDRYSERMSDIIFRRSAMLGFHWESGTNIVLLKAEGHSFHISPQIPIVFRVDKGLVRRWEWEWLGEAAITFHPGIFTMLLKDLENGKQAVFRVGSKKGVVSLNGVSDAIKDFQSRVARSIN